MNVSNQKEQTKADVNPEFLQYQTADVKIIGGKNLKTVAYYADETFKAFPNNPDIMVGSRGLVYNRQTGCKIKQNKSVQKNGTSYSFVHIPKYGLIPVHRLMMMTYNPIPNVDDMAVVHTNDINMDNRLENLQWVSKQDVSSKNLYRPGESSPNAKFSEVTVRQICELMVEGKMPTEIASILNIPYSEAFCNYVSSLRTGYIWTHVTKDYTFPPTNTNKYTEEEVVYICELLSQGIERDDIIRIMKEKFNKEVTAYFVDNIFYKNDKVSQCWRPIIEKYTFPKRKKAPLLTQEEVHYVCKLIEQGYGLYDILERLNKPERDHENLKNLIRKISKGVCYKNIAQQYDILNKLPAILPRHDTDDIHEICRLLDLGYDRDMIAEKMNIENKDKLAWLIYKLKNGLVHSKIASQYKFYHTSKKK